MHQDLYYGKTMQPTNNENRCIILSHISRTRVCKKKCTAARFSPSEFNPS